MPTPREYSTTELAEDFREWRDEQRHQFVTQRADLDDIRRHLEVTFVRQDVYRVEFAAAKAERDFTTKALADMLIARATDRRLIFSALVGPTIMFLIVAVLTAVLLGGPIS